MVKLYSKVNYMNKNIVYNKTDSIEMDIFYETNGSNLSLKNVAKKKKKWKKWVLIFLTLVFIVVLVYSLLKILFWFAQVGPVSSQESSKVEEGGRRRG